MELYSAILTGLIALSIFYYTYILFLSTNPNKKKSPPEAGGAWPLIGHLPLISGTSATTLPHIALGSLADKHGPIFTIRVGVHRTVVVSSWELAKELFTTNDASVSSRPAVVVAKYLSYNFAMFGFSSYGPYWRWARKFIAAELLSNRRLELLSHVRVSETGRSLIELYELWNEKKDGSGRLMVDMKEWLGNLNLNAVMRMVTGKRLYGLETRGTEAREAMREFFHLSGLFVAADALPFLGLLDLGGYQKKMKETAVKLDKIIGGWLEEHRRGEYSGKGGDDKKRDFIDVMLSAVKQADVEVYDADTVIKALCLTLIGGGSDSTSIALVWALSLLLNNRHVLKKAQEELDVQIGKDRRVNESDLNNLIYLQAIVKETLRLYPVIPLTVRKFDQDCEIGGYHIRKGTRLMVNLWKIHRDPRVWSDHDPFEFFPERFIKMPKDVKSQNFDFIPFGAGRRICPAMNFGLEMLHLVLANFLHAFEFSTLNDELVDMTESAGLTNSKAIHSMSLLALDYHPISIISLAIFILRKLMNYLYVALCCSKTLNLFVIFK